MARYSDTLTNDKEPGVTGPPIIGALVAVKSQSGTTPTLYADDGVTVLKNPLTSDEYGVYYFNAPADFFDFKYYYGGRLILERANIAVGMPTLPTGFIADTMGTATNVAPSQRAVSAAVDGFGSDIIALEGEIGILQGVVTSGRRGYTTYASAVSDAATPVIYPAVTAGTIAEIPITDAGTHTDPVVGGTVNNSGIFRWSVSPAGWLRISDVDAVAAGGYAAAAAGSATTATTQAGIATAAAATAVTASVVPLLNANKMGLQRTVPSADLVNGYGAPAIASNGQITFSGAGAIKGFLYYLNGSDLARRTAGLPFTARVPIVSGAPTSARLIQFNSSNVEVGTRPTASISATEIGFHNVVLNSVTTKLQLELTIGASPTVTTFMAVSQGEPATAVADPLYREAEGYYLEQLNEAPLVTPTYTYADGGTGGTFVAGVLSQGANAGAASSLESSATGFVVGGRCRLRFRANSRLLQAGIQTAYTGDLNVFSQPTFNGKLTEVSGDSGHVFYDFQFIIPPHPTVPAYPLRAIILTFYSPAEAVICDDFIAAAAYQLPPVRTPPLAVRTYISNAIATALAAGGTTLQVPTAAIDLWGDSLVDFGHATGSVSDALSTLLGGSIPVQNLGVATQNALEIAMRAGGTPVLLSLVGDAIPATTTTVAISNFNAASCPITIASTTTNVTDPLAGSLGGVPGRLDAVRAGGAGTAVTGLTFTRTTAGSIVPINKNTPFLPTQGEATRSKHQVMIWGKNDVGGSGGTATGNLIADLYDRQFRAMLPIDKRFLIGSVLHSNHDTATEVINDINAAIAARFSRYMVDLTSAPTTEEMASVSFSPTSDDLTDMDAVVVATVSGTTLTINSVTSGTVTQWKYLDPQVFRGNFTINSGSGTSWVLSAAPGNFTSQTITIKGFIPRGMRGGGYSGGAGVLGGDQLHLNTTGNQLWALRLFRAFKQRGWF